MGLTVTACNSVPGTGRMLNVRRSKCNHYLSHILLAEVKSVFSGNSY